MPEVSREDEASVLVTCERAGVSGAAGAGVSDGSAVLDIPCGGGLAMRGVRNGQRLRYVAADISPDMLDRARRHEEINKGDLSGQAGTRPVLRN